MPLARPNDVQGFRTRQAAAVPGEISINLDFLAGENGPGGVVRQGSRTYRHGRDSQYGKAANIQHAGSLDLFVTVYYAVPAGRVLRDPGVGRSYATRLSCEST